MRRLILITPLILSLVLTAGCGHRLQEADARLSGAEDMATAARVHADESSAKADKALQAALAAKESADVANERAQRLINTFERAQRLTNNFERVN